MKKLKKISLNKSKEVLEERQHLEKQVEILQIALKEGLDKISYIKGIINMIKSVKGNLNGSKNFTKKIKTFRPQKYPVYDNRLITTCLVCSHTCHDKCRLADEGKYLCACMKRDKQTDITAHAQYVRENVLGDSIKIYHLFIRKFLLKKL